MAIEIRSARFDGHLPTAGQIRDQAERMGGLAIEVLSLFPAVSSPPVRYATAGLQTMRLAFDAFLEEIVTVTVAEQMARVSISAQSGSAPVLLNLLYSAAIELGGSGRMPPFPLALPLTEKYVAATTAARRADLLRLNLLLLRAIVLALAGVLGVIAGLAWIAFEIFWG